MFGCRTVIGVGCLALALGWISGCGGVAERGNGRSTAGGGSSGEGGGGSGQAGFGSGGANTPRAGAAGSSGASAGVGGLVDPKPIESGCPMKELPPPTIECDPFTPGSCGPGSACYPFVAHPDGNGCDEQMYGTVCQLAGTGTQGSLCGEDVGDYCAEGFVCVIGQRAGKRCAALCKLGAEGQCSGGLICGDLDVAGYGVCG